jgi:Ca2+-binding RTX toxin-like protein
MAERARLLRRAPILALALAATGLTAQPAGASHEFLCKPGPASDWNIAHGTISADTFTGTNGATSDCYDGKAGNDTINLTNAGGGNRLLGGPGNDAIHGGQGASQQDAINAEAGDDLVWGEAGPDFGLFGGSGDDVVHGNAGRDNLFGGGWCIETTYWGFNYWGGDVGDTPRPLNDCAYEAGDDGADVLYGDTGDDWLWESNSGTGGDDQVDYVDGGPGYDVCTVEAIDIVTDCEEVDVVD